MQFYPAEFLTEHAHAHDAVGGKFEPMENGHGKPEYVHFRGRLCHHLEINKRKTKGLLRWAREREGRCLAKSKDLNLIRQCIDTRPYIYTVSMVNVVHVVVDGRFPRVNVMWQWEVEAELSLCVQLWCAVVHTSSTAVSAPVHPGPGWRGLVSFRC